MLARDRLCVPNRLVLEITESGAMRDPEATHRHACALCAALAFASRSTTSAPATRHSSHLRDFPIDFLKVAKPFVDGIDERRRRADVRGNDSAARRVARHPGVAEGIEAGSQAATLESIGCRLGQGFHYAKPLRPAELPLYLRPGLRLVA